jgi:hydroxymethylglutaryl-CoA reductase
VGVVGGTIKNHPTAGAALKMLDVSGARELGELVAAVGLAQNLAALRALATEGIQRGHMSMHARSLVARVLPEASEDMRAKVLAELIRTKDVKEARALAIYQELTST